MASEQCRNAVPAPVVAVLLAAGGSRRLGQPKQLLPWYGKSLLVHAIEQLAAAGCERMFVVIGAYAEQCLASYDTHSGNRLAVTFGHHHGWAQGQASSLRFGLQLANASMGQPFHLLVALCDQPLLSAAHYKLLIESVRDEHFMVASARYPEGGGVPACLHHRCHSVLHASSADEGVKAWIRQQPDSESVSYDFGIAVSDIDTAQQWASLTNSHR